MSKKKKTTTKTKRGWSIHEDGPFELVIALVRPQTRSDIEQLAVMARRYHKDPSFVSGDVAGKLLDAVVPVFLKEARKKMRRMKQVQ